MPAFLPVQLHTPRLTLRFIGAEDTGAMFQLFADADAVRYWSCPPWQAMTQASDYVAQTLQGYADGSSLRWALVNQDHAVVGVVTLYHFDRQNARCDVGYMLARPYWGQRYMQEALAAVFDYGFGPLALHRIEADIHPDNAASVRLLQSLHFRLEGHLRERWFVAGEISDSLILGLLARDWRSARERPAD
ncbi:GNAT family N-acetyltransferase [Pseudoduganella sp. FT93W]|uniref:GNAT family N-acetyltransferase n=1 Tax=Duganella fentianensis TaxID=2692177 RepID=A0A845I093_9BURK|nr:GNAT family N-acetyltransferase [Duganella fentianensis]MYN47034.1 GNAT family N-acetyltransferase [Duganella fentianensis]